MPSSHRHLDLPLQAPAAKSEGGAVGGAGDRATGTAKRAGGAAAEEAQRLIA